MIRKEIDVNKIFLLVSKSNKAHEDSILDSFIWKYEKLV